ncbi:MAG: heme-binding protein, partial [Deltaproteobacteria bacterium]
LKSSYAVGRGWAKRGVAPSSERGLDPMDYTGAGGAFPLRVKGAGVIGTITVSGVPERDDHMLVVRSIAQFLQIDLKGLELPPEH